MKNATSYSRLVIQERLAFIAGGEYMVKLVCRKCWIEFNCTDWKEVRLIQLETCGGGGCHRLVGRGGESFAQDG